MRIIRDTDPLDSSFIPDRLIARERELSIIKENVINPLREGITSPLWVYGYPGVGKTVTLKFLQKTVKSPRIIYENALSHGSIRAILTSMLSQLGRFIPPSGTTYKQIFTALRDLSAKSGTDFILVLDEASQLYRDMEGMYNLSRAGEIHGVLLSPIFISIDPPEVYSSFRERAGAMRMSTLKFNKYSSDELYFIVKDRSESALNDGAYDDTILHYIAETSEPYGSARVAIETLQKAAFMAEYRNAESIEIEDVRGAVSLIDPYITESKLAELNAKDLVTLLAVCRLLRVSVSTDMKHIVPEIRSVMEAYPVVRNEFRVYDTVRRLERAGFVTSHVIGRGDRKGVSKVIQINDIPVSILSQKIESILSRMSA